MSRAHALPVAGAGPLGVELSAPGIIFTPSNSSAMKILFPLFLLLPLLLAAQTDSVPQAAPRPAALLPQFDSATVWEGVRIKTAQVFGEKDVEPDFKIKNKAKKRELIAALEGQFQVNVADSEIRSIKKAGALADYIFQAQQGIVMFSKAGFQGKVERIAGNRQTCKENADCLNFIGSLIVPKGIKVTLYNQPKFKGDQLLIDASQQEVRINSFMTLRFEGAVTTTNRSVNWREEVRSIRVAKN
jgi:hypothetical protein